jgi:hypothetical protein
MHKIFVLNEGILQNIKKLVAQGLRQIFKVLVMSLKIHIKRQIGLVIFLKEIRVGEVPTIGSLFYK